MTWTASHPGLRESGRRTRALTTAPATIHWPRGLAVIGLAALLVSAWGGVVAYVGPTFDFGADGTPAWTWSLTHSLLYLAPGGVGVVASLAVISRSRGGATLTRLSLAFLGLVLVACGAWFVVGPYAWPILEGPTTLFSPTSSALTMFTRLVGHNLGVGVVLAALGGMVMKAGTGEREVELVAYAPAPMAAAPPVGGARPVYEGPVDETAVQPAATETYPEGDTPPTS